MAKTQSKGDTGYSGTRWPTRNSVGENAKNVSLTTLQALLTDSIDLYNATRQVGSVLGSAVVATVMSTLLATSPQTPDGIASAMSGTLLLPAASILTVGVIACFLERPKHQRKN